ncbi:dihydroxy-acid dehydratase domain-containing protein, partial [Nonomuraea fuscirosea]|uniref:dihydroxy-acid dehydratase domain-containing protein n=1 Tax=Nonomuraea fuscirosea TaxID=1291556 RepID=UPI0033EB1D57
EDFYRAGGVPAVMRSLLAAGRLHGDVVTVSGRTVAENGADAPPADPTVIRPFDDPLAPRGGLLVMTGNLFDSAVMKTSVLTGDLPAVSEYRAVVFDGPEDYHARIGDPGLDLDANCILVIRYTGPIGYPGSAEVVNMEVPAALLRQGITTLPTLGDGRQSGTSDAPSLLNASPEAAAGGNLAILRTGDRIRIDLDNARVDVLLPDEEIAARWTHYTPPILDNQTPWQEIYRSTVGQLDSGGCLELALAYQDLVHTKGIPAGQGPGHPPLARPARPGAEHAGHRHDGGRGRRPGPVAPGDPGGTGTVRGGIAGAGTVDHLPGPGSDPRASGPRYGLRTRCSGGHAARAPARQPAVADHQPAFPRTPEQPGRSRQSPVPPVAGLRRGGHDRVPHRG